MTPFDLRARVRGWFSTLEIGLGMCAASPDPCDAPRQVIVNGNTVARMLSTNNENELKAETGVDMRHALTVGCVDVIRKSTGIRFSHRRFRRAVWRR